MNGIFKVALIGSVLALTGCATMTETERGFLGAGAGFVLAGPLGVPQVLGTVAGAGIGIFSDNILGY